MKNSEKIDINLEADSAVDQADMTEEERSKGYYETALRYINIAKYMKQYEDQDKYYHRALANLRKARKTGMRGLKPLMKDVVYHKYFARANGKISLYKEACSIRDNARTPTDYLMAQTLFDRIHKYETLHQIQEKYVSPDLYEEVCKCADSAQQSALCGEMASQLSAKQRRKSLISSGIFLILIIALLAFSRTLQARVCLAEAYALFNRYDKAFPHYEYVYNKTGDQAAFEKYEDYRYQAAVRGAADRNREDVRDSFRELARLGYKDSESWLVKLEKARIAELAEGEKIRFGEVNWRILDHQDDRVLLLKDKTQGETPFQADGSQTDWEHSSIRNWFNHGYLDELFPFASEKEAIIDSQVPASDNAFYGTKGGQATTDKLFLLSDEEFKAYSYLLPNTHNMWWLRTPGNSLASAAYVSPDKSVMAYGADTGNQEVKARPALWVSTKE